MLWNLLAVMGSWLVVFESIDGILQKGQNYHRILKKKVTSHNVIIEAKTVVENATPEVELSQI